MRRALFIICVLVIGVALGFAVAGVPRRSVDRRLAARPTVTSTTVDPASAPATVDTTPAPTTSTSAP
jgi:hypothetical protein